MIAGIANDRPWRDWRQRDVLPDACRILVLFWRYRLTVRTEPSQGLNTGSIPVSATKSNLFSLSYKLSDHI